MNSENHNTSKIYLVPNDIDGGDAAAVEQLSLEQVRELCDSMLDCLATTKADGVPSLQRLVFSPEADGDGENAPPATKRRRTEEGEDATAAKARSASMIFYSVSIEVPAGSRRTVEEIVSESLEAINSCEDQLKYLNVVSSQQQQLNGKRQSRQIFRATKDYPQPAQSSDVTEGDKNTIDGRKSTDKNTEKVLHRPPANVKITTPFVQSPFDPAHHVPYELLVQHLIDHHSEDSLLDLEGDAAKSLLVIGCDNDSGKKNSTTTRGGGSSLPPAFKKEMYGSSVGVQPQHPQGMASTGGFEAPHSVVSSTATTGAGQQQQQQVSAGLPPPSSSGGLLAQPTSVQQLQQQQREREHNYPEGVNELFLGYKQTSEPPHESKVREFFSPFCAAAVVRHVRPKYCFFVMFTSPEEAQKAYRSVGRTIQLGDTALRVGWATQRPKNPSPTGDQPQQQQQLQLGGGGAGGMQHQQSSVMSGGYPPQHHQHQQQQQHQPPQQQNLQQLQQLQPPLQSGPGNNTTGAPPNNNNNNGSGGNFISQDVVSQSTSNTLPKNHHAGQYHEAHHRGGVVHLAHHLHPSPLGGASESANNNNSNNNNNRNSVGMGAGGGLSPSNHHQQPQQQQSAYSGGGGGAQPSYPQQSAQPGLGYQQQQQMYGYQQPQQQQHSQQQIPQQQLAGPAGTITIGGGGPAGAARGGGGGGLPPLPAHLSGILNSNNGATSQQHPQQSVQSSSIQQLSSSVPVNSSSSPFFVLALSQLAPSVTERSVFNRLQPFTPVSIKVVGSCAFCEFPTREAAQDALNYVQSKTLDGAPISVRLLQQ